MLVDFVPENLQFRAPLCRVLPGNSMIFSSSPVGTTVSWNDSEDGEKMDMVMMANTLRDSWRLWLWAHAPCRPLGGDHHIVAMHRGDEMPGQEDAHVG